jgi:hypothetical protein
LSLAVWQAAASDSELVRHPGGRWCWIDRTGVGCYRDRQVIRASGLAVVQRWEMGLYGLLDAAGQDRVLDAKEVFGIGTELVEVKPPPAEQAVVVVTETKQ